MYLSPYVLISFLFPLFSFSPSFLSLPPFSLSLLFLSLFLQITPQFYSSLTAPQLQQSILHSVLDLMIASTSSSLTVAAKQSLQQVILQIKSKSLQLFSSSLIYCSKFSLRKLEMSEFTCTCIIILVT